MGHQFALPRFPPCFFAYRANGKNKHVCISGFSEDIRIDILANSLHEITEWVKLKWFAHNYAGAAILSV